VHQEVTIVNSDLPTYRTYFANLRF